MFLIQKYIYKILNNICNFNKNNNSLDESLMKNDNLYSPNNNINNSTNNDINNNINNSTNNDTNNGINNDTNNDINNGINNDTNNDINNDTNNGIDNDTNNDNLLNYNNIPLTISNNTEFSNIDKFYFLDINSYINTLKENGYVIIPNVYNEYEINNYLFEFNNWLKNVENLEYLHNIIDYNGIFKHHQVGHQRFAWLARTNPKILKIFKKLWNTDELVTSFDGCCYYPKNYNNNPQYWTHSDQSSLKKGLNCYQSFLSLTNNSERTFVVYEKTHNYHESYFTEMGISEPRDWNIIDHNYLMSNHMEKQKFLNINAGDLVIWDSRTFHQNTCGSSICNEERLIQYLCYLPKNDPRNTEKEQNKRINYFNKKRTTSHWPYPMNVVPEQPNLYNYYYPDNPIYIDYNNLPEPNLNDLIDSINKLL